MAESMRAPADYAGCPATVHEAIAEGRELVAPRWGLWDVVIALGLMAAMGFGLAGVLALLEAVTGTEPALGVLVVLGIVVPWIGLAGWPLIATARRGNGPRIDLGMRLTWSDTAWGAGAGVASLLCAGIAAGITTRIHGDVVSSAGELGDQLIASHSTLAVIVFSFLVMVGAPVAEELFFRGLVFDSLRKRGFSAVWTIVITGVAFAAFHFEPIRFLILLPTGLILGWVRSRTGSLGASMVAHGLVNAPGALVLLVGAAGMTP